MSLSIIVAMDKNRVIGKDNKLPWHLPAELQYFKKITMGHPIVMGRKTHESIGRALPGRTNIVVTRNQEYQSKDCVIIHTVEEIISYGEKEAEIFIIGGAELIKQCLSHTDKLYITWIEHVFEGDTYFPEIAEDTWKLVSKEPGVKDEKNPYTYYYLVYERVV